MMILLLMHLLHAVDETRGIIDLMLSKSIHRNPKEGLEHLVVELKAPNVKIGSKEITQIESYAFAIAANERFKSINTRWNFWIISSDLDDFAKMRLKNKADGSLHNADGIIIWVKTWSEVIFENKTRLDFIRNQLNYNVDRERSFIRLKEKYAELTQGIKTSFDKDIR